MSVRVRVAILSIVALVFAGALALGLSEAVPLVRAVGAQTSGDAMAGELLRRAALRKLQALEPREVQRRVDQEIQWHRQTLTQAYNRAGRRNPKWDDAARQALELTAQLYADDPARPGDVSDRIPDLLGAALTAGCDDPLVVFLHGKFADDYGREAAAIADLRLAATRLERSPYPAFRRALALVLAVNAPAELPKHRQPPITPQEVAQGGELLDRATALLPEVLRDLTIPDRQLKVLVGELAKGRQRLGADRRQAYESVVPMLTKSRPPDAAVLPLIKAVVLTEYAWDTRGHAYINKVSDENQVLFTQRIEEAGAALNEAIGKGTTDQSIGTAMMRIVLVLGDEDREMAEWFDVARRLAPGSYEPYNSRRNSLLPRWDGSDEALLAFGRAAFARQEWGSRAPLELVEVHQWIAKGPPVKPGYLARADVCADIKSVYDALLARYPDASTDRSRYARRLITCKAWRDADAQFQRLGDRASMSVFGGREKYDAERTLVANRLASSR